MIRSGFWCLAFVCSKHSRRMLSDELLAAAAQHVQFPAQPEREPEYNLEDEYNHAEADEFWREHSERKRT